MGVCSSLRGTKDSRRNRAIVRLNSACDFHADVEFDDRIPLLAPPWGSAVHFGGPKIRARIALSLGAVPPNPGVNLACNLLADAGFDDSITHMAPPWGSAVDFGGHKIRARIGALARSCASKPWSEFCLQFVGRRWIRRQYHTYGFPMGVCS